MSEKQIHTPGPWEVSSHQTQIHSERYGLVATLQEFTEKSTTHANARLIAAAPEMYELLKEIFRLSEIGLSNGILYGKKLVTEMGTENIPTHEKVRAILDKVEGETA